MSTGVRRGNINLNLSAIRSNGFVKDFYVGKSILLNVFLKQTEITINRFISKYFSLRDISSRI